MSIPQQRKSSSGRRQFSRPLLGVLCANICFEEEFGHMASSPLDGQ